VKKRKRYITVWNQLHFLCVWFLVIPNYYNNFSKNQWHAYVDSKRSWKVFLITGRKKWFSVFRHCSGYCTSRNEELRTWQFGNWLLKTIGKEPEGATAFSWEKEKKTFATPEGNLMWLVSMKNFIESTGWALGKHVKGKPASLKNLGVI
jgi:hypothetical protein